MEMKEERIVYEKKWQKKWEEEKIGFAKDFSDNNQKFYCLVEFPYPSGAGLHVGHTRSYTALDVIARKKRMEGSNVLFPIGWDAFGLPAENYAIKTATHPRVTTQNNINIFRKQLKSVGLSFDWSREVDTTDSAYYKWTQWIFLRLFEKGLAYKKKMNINWCTKCNVGLANEEVVNGVCERCGGMVIQKEREQWMLKITEYAQRLLDDLKLVDYPARVKKQQQDWIGRSEGARIKFQITNSKSQINSNAEISKQEIEVFTTRPDTLFGVTFIVLAPEHSLVDEITTEDQKKKIVEYKESARKKTDLERAQLQKEKTGVWTGAYAINPATQKEIPVWIADYVITTYGTGAIMAVPAHDERDFEFATRYNISVQEVIVPQVNTDKTQKKADSVYTGEGSLVNSGEFNELSSQEAGKKITEKFGTAEVQFKLRDWVFSRQRYWGEPIPLVFCPVCEKQTGISNNPIPTGRQEFPISKGELLNPGWVAVPDDQLPVKLPDVEKYTTTETGDSPLANISEWVNTTCPRCGGPARRETDTMPNWAGSSWYYLRYTDPHNNTVLADKKNLEYWTPVDWYNGGMEHVTLHLLYSRFWHKFLYDIGVVPTSEPYKKRTSHGMILGPDGEKMSKSRGNVINPDDMIQEFGADAYRVYQMFMGPFEEAIPWMEQGILGAERFLNRVWKLSQNDLRDYSVTEISIIFQNILHKTIKKVGDDIESLKFNTAISALMILFNAIEKESITDKKTIEIFLKLLAPFAPFMTEEIWREKLGHTTSIHTEQWPIANPTLLGDVVVIVAVQVNGKTRGTLEIPSGLTESETLEIVRKEKVGSYIEGKEIKKIIFVQDKIINIITS
jgi:leucyl-tRNA synthetase